MPRPVVKMCTFMPAASCSVPQMKSLAGVAAYTKPLGACRRVPSALRKPSKLKPSSGAWGSRCKVAIGKPSSEHASGMRKSRS